MIPRAFWWLVLGIALIDFLLNTWACLFDRAHWHRDVTIVGLLTISLTIHRLIYPPKTKGDIA